MDGSERLEFLMKITEHTLRLFRIDCGSLFYY